MRAILLAGLGILITLSSRAADQPASQAYQAELTNISQRVRSGDYQALFDAAKLPASVAVPYISGWAGWGPGPRPPTDQSARAALQEVAGYADFLREDIAKASAEGRVPGYDFNTLEEIDTPEAAQVVAPYLFDVKTVTPPNGDLQGDSNVGAALLTLQRMNIPNAPKISSEASNSAVLIAWQRWAIANGLVSKGWSSRVGAPSWLLALDAAGSTAPSRPKPSPMQIKNSPSPSSSPSPFTAATANPSNTPPSVLETTSPKNTLTVVSIGVVVLLAIVGVFMWKKRP